MTDYLVSVVIPVYNCELYLQQCVESLLKQTHKSLEILLVDDGATDKSPKVCDEFASKSNLVKVLHKENSGAAAARKTGIMNATGQYVLFVDADDWLEEKYVETLLNVAVNSQVDVVVGTFQCYAENSYTKYKHIIHEGLYNKTQCEEEIFHVMLSAKTFFNFGVSPSMCGKLFKAEIVKKNVDTLDTGIIFGEDGCFTYSALLDCESIYITDQCGYIYRHNAMSATHRFNEKLLPDGKKLKAFLEKIAVEKDWNVNNQIDEYMAYVCNYTVTRALKSGYANTKEGKRKLKTYVAEIFPKKFFQNAKIRKCEIKTKVRYALVRYCAFSLLTEFLSR